MPRFKRVASTDYPAESEAEHFEAAQWDALEAPRPNAPPAHWGRGALLNVRNTGSDYLVTLYPEEYDAKHPERAMRFAHSGLLQDFVSKWYMRENRDPRAMG